MNLETLFSICNYTVIPAWLLLAVLPHHRFTMLLVHAVWVPLLLAPLYAYMLFFGGPTPEGGGFGSLEAVMILFTSPTATLAGWIHYLVLDLFVGAWIVRDAKRQGINHWLTLPFLFGTFWAGPFGLALYLLLRLGMKRELSVRETATA